MALHVLSAILFSPRGGSASAARALAGALSDRGCTVTLVVGSRSDLGPHGDARTFYRNAHAVSFDAALASPEPLGFEGPPGSVPMHPSYEDRAGAPDVVFAALDDSDYERQVQAWCRELELAGARNADILHLHHLTPLNEAAVRVAPHVPIVGQLHGTELLMLERIASGGPASWSHAERWAERLRGWAAHCARLIVAPSGVTRAVDLLGVVPERVVALPNGVDVELFAPRVSDRHRFWQATLGARYDRTAVERLAAGVVLLYVGRFTAVKRLDRLIAAFGAAQDRFGAPAGLVLVGGHPGELEGEHPADIAQRLGVSDVFLAGWHAQEQLPAFFAAADASVLCSEREQFGQVLVEAMACGVPAIATRSLGPEAIIEDGSTGWLVASDDETALVAALTEAVNDPAERQRRGRQALLAARERYSWTGIAAQLASVLEDVVGEGAMAHPRRTAPPSALLPATAP